MYQLFAILWYLTCTAPALMKCSEEHPLLDKMLQASRSNSCTTAKGENGLCTNVAMCQGHNSAFDSDCHPDATTESLVCCPMSQLNDRNRQKRSSNSSAAPDLRTKGCGVRSWLTEFVVGGQDAEFWPWMAAIYVQSSGSRVNRFRCGGTVISKRFILTAAHCLEERRITTHPSLVTVRVGSLVANEGSEFSVSQVIVHENYSSVLHYDDIALLRTSTDMEVKNVVPVCLPSSGMFNANFYKRQAVLIGWGNEIFGGSPSNVLKEANVQIVSSKVCEQKYKKLNTFALTMGIISTQICAGSNDGSVDSCQGDSGGPLLVQDKSGKWTIAGIVSFGYGCGDPNFPGVYTRVAKYLYWLEEKMKA